jgi:beta-glucosidase
VAHDFRGKLSFSWPKSATQYALHRGQPGYDPLFAFGFGLTYRDRQELPLLSEESGVTGADAPGGTLFGGVEATAWRMGTGGGVQLTRFDRQRQEDSFRLLWTGAPGALGFDSAQGEDFSRETNADMLLVLTVKVDAAPDAATTLTASCGTGCAASVPVTADLAALPAGQWLRLGVPLKCFTRAGADMGRRVGRFELGSAGRLDLSVNRIALGTDVDRRASCPVP